MSVVGSIVLQTLFTPSRPHEYGMRASMIELSDMPPALEAISPGARAENRSVIRSTLHTINKRLCLLRYRP